ncbi:MAG: hypothetical protein Q8L86_21485 [Vicinamibacterales bacterium]|nr:hypothetical protein [Vicinamibacterales bacterium]
MRCAPFPLAAALAATLAGVSGCARPESPLPAAVAEPGADVAGEFWGHLSALCGKAFEGLPTEVPKGVTSFAARPLIMHVRECSDTEIRIPVHVGPDRSRTWVITRQGDGLRLKHDHRREDGTEDPVTQYGGDWDPSASTGLHVEFPADDFTVALTPETRTNVWTLEIQPGSRFIYALRREGTDRRIRLVFELIRDVEAPPPPWGDR